MMEDMQYRVTDEDYKACLLGILARIHRVCEENHIRYSAIFGTCLGAIRHKGFIPWDDDIDICMPREDYLLFTKAFHSDDGRYYVLDSKEPLYFNNFMRACDNIMTLKMEGNLNIQHLGAFVDVFLLDNWPDSIVERVNYCKEIEEASRRIRLALPWSVYKTYPIKRQIRSLMHFPSMLYNRYYVGLERRKKERDQLLLRYASRKTKYKSVAFDRPGKLPWYIAEDELDNRILMPFENIEVYCHADYDRLLKECYGNYMEFPPVDKRRSHHHFIPYWNIEYSQYR